MINKKNILNRLLQNLSIFIYLVLIVVLPGIHLSNQSIIIFHDSHRLLEILLFVPVLIYASINDLAWCNYIHNPIISKLFLAFFILLGFSVAIAPSFRSAIIELSIFGGLSYLALFMAKLASENFDQFVKQVCFVFWLSILIYMSSTYWAYFEAINANTPTSWPKVLSGFTNVRSFNQFQLWSLALVYLPIIAFNINNYTKFLMWVFLCAWWMLLIYSSSRGVLIAIAISMTVTLIIYKKIAWRLISLQISTAATATLGYYYLFQTTPQVKNISVVTPSIIRETTFDRIALWGKSLEFIQHYPIFGIGPMGYPWLNDTLAHPHSSILQLAAELGLPATIILVLIAFYACYRWITAFSFKRIQNKSKLDQNVTVVLFFTMVANILYSFVDGVIVMPISQVLMATILGLTLTQFIDKREGSATNRLIVNLQTKGLTVAPVLCLLALTWSAVPEIKQALSGSEKRFSIGYNAPGPRIWWEIR